MQFIHDVFGLFLLFFPKNYREEYGEELQIVFALSLEDAASKGGFELEKVILRELVNLPVAVITEYLRERRKAKMTREYTSRFDFAPGSRKEVLAAVAPFLLFGAVPILIGLSGRFFTITRPYILEVVLSICMFVSVISLLVLGFFRSVPRWFMPYLGLPLPLLCLLILSGLVNLWSDFSFSYISSRFLRSFVRDGFLWGSLIPQIILLVALFGIVQRFHPFYRQLRNDWTLVCFILYGAAPSMALIQYEGYQNYGPYVILMFLILAAGGWLYLRNEVLWKKFLILIGGVTLSMFTAAVGQAVLYESSLYNSHRSFPDYPWWATVDGTVIAWIWLVLIMFLPLMINMLPRLKIPLQAGEPAAG